MHATSRIGTRVETLFGLAVLLVLLSACAHGHPRQTRCDEHPTTISDADGYEGYRISHSGSIPQPAS